MDNRSKELEAAMADIENAAASLMRAAKRLRGQAVGGEDDYPAGEQEYDRRALEEADRERAAGEEVVYPAFVADLMIEGKHPIYAWRKYRRIPQMLVAEKAGIVASTLARIESRSVAPRDSTLAKIAKVLDVPVAALEDLEVG